MKYLLCDSLPKKLETVLLNFKPSIKQLKVFQAVSAFSTNVRFLFERNSVSSKGLFVLRNVSMIVGFWILTKVSPLINCQSVINIKV